MPSQTAQGYPYPLPSEPVRDGAVAIRNLAEAIQARLPITRSFWLRGGFTTNSSGGIDITTGFTVSGAIAITEAAGYMCKRSATAPANHVYIDIFGTTGALVPNTFIVLNIAAWAN